MTEKKKRRRDRRVKTPRPMQLTSRDVAVIEGVHLYRVLRQDQIQALYFSARNRSGTQRRLEKLYDHGFLERRFLPVTTGRSPTLYVLDRKGAELLRTERGYDELTWYSTRKDLKPDFLAHTLAINDVMVAVNLACQQMDYQLEAWRTENQLKADYDRVSITTETGRRELVPIIPDSFFTIIARERRYPFFLELDRGTMTLARFQTKVHGYVAYQRTGRYEQRFGVRSLRTLTVTPGQQRLANLKQATESAGGREWFWFAVLSDLTPEQVLTAPVWSVATRTDPAPLIRVTDESAE